MYVLLSLFPNISSRYTTAGMKFKNLLKRKDSDDDVPLAKEMQKTMKKVAEAQPPAEAPTKLLATGIIYSVVSTPINSIFSRSRRSSIG